MNHVHRVAVDILRRGVEPPRHPLAAPVAPAPLIDFGLAEEPQQAAAQLWFCPLRCGCIGVVAFGRCGIRTYCAAHQPPSIGTQRRVELCPQCGGPAWVTTPRGTHCSGCQYVAVETRLGS